VAVTSALASLAAAAAAAAASGRQAGTAGWSLDGRRLCCPLSVSLL